MLVATASLGLIAPIAAQASDAINLEGINNYNRSNKSSSKRFDNNTFVNEVNEDLATLKGRVDGLEANQNNLEAGSFSETTTLDGKAIFAIGGISGADSLDKGEQVNASYVYQMNLNTSFSGDDNLYVRLKTGDGWEGVWDHKPGTYHIDTKDNGDALNVDKIWYTFPLGEKFTATVGPKIENYYMLAATPSVYKPGVLKGFKLGGHGAAFGASTSTGAGLKYLADNGFGVSTTFNSKQAAGAGGLFTDEDQSKVNTQVAYTKDNYHVSATYSIQKGWNSWSYYATEAMHDGAGETDVKASGYALRAWWRPDETGTAVPSVSVGYDIIDFGDTRANGVEAGSGYMVGLNWADMFQADDKIGLAIGQPMKATSGEDDPVDPFMWEAYYSFKPNDSIELRPGVFGTTDVSSDTDQDLFGAVLTTTFKF